MVAAFKKLFWNAHANFLWKLVNVMSVIAWCNSCSGEVLCILSRNCTKQASAGLGVAAQWPKLVKAHCHVCHAIAGNCSVSGLDSNSAGECCRAADASARVFTKCNVAKASCNCG